MKNSSTKILVAIVILFVVGAAVFWMTKGNTSVTNTNNPTSVASQYQATSGNSNANLDQDMNTINASLNDTNSSISNVSTSINDTPIPQP